MNNIQEIIDNSIINQELILPIGEFEGPFYINKPLTLTGNSTTLWARKGPILVICSNNVIIKNIRVEITEEIEYNSKDFVCINTNTYNTTFIDVEIIGNIEGINGESGIWQFPKLISLGDFKAEAINKFNIEVEVPVRTELISNVKDIKINPSILSPGKNKICITTEKLRDNTFLYGEILFKSMFSRRIYISGKAVKNLSNYIDNETIFKISENKNMTSKAVIPCPNIIAPMISDSSIIVLKRGQRTSIKDITGYNIKLTLSYDKMLRQMDIDPYIFLLNSNEKAIEDNKLIFFGNIKSECGSIMCSDENDDKLVNINFDTIPLEITKIAVAYSIYGDNLNENFSKVINPVIRIFSKEKEKIRFYPQDLLVETTIVAVEFYRYKNEWKVNTVGAGYREGLKRLCESYGLTVI